MPHGHRISTRTKKKSSSKGSSPASFSLESSMRSDHQLSSSQSTSSSMSEKFDDSSDDSDDDLLNYEPFAPSDETEPKDYLLAAPKENNKVDADTPRKNDLSEDANEISAKRRAYNATIPSNITSLKQLKWCFKPTKTKRYSTTPQKRKSKNNDGVAFNFIHTPSIRYTYKPVRMCDPTEGLGLDFKPSDMVGKKVLVQYIDGVVMGERQMVPKTSLVPFHNNININENDTLVGKDHDCSVGVKGNEVWCPELKEKYNKSVLRKKHNLSACDIRASLLFLERIVNEVKTREFEQQETSVDDTEFDKAQSSNYLDVQEHSNDTDEEDDEMDDPYTQNTEIFRDLRVCEPLDSCTGRRNKRKRSEPLRAGDVITYRSPIFISGDKRGVRVTTVLEISPKSYPLVVLNNREVLSNEMQIKRVKIVSGKKKLKVEDHSTLGVYRPVEEFKLVKGRIKIDDLPHDHPARISRKSGGINGVIQRNLEKFQRDLKEDKDLNGGNGIPVADLMHKCFRKRRENDEEHIEPASADDSSFHQKRPCHVDSLEECGTNVDSTIILSPSPPPPGLNSALSLKQSVSSLSEVASSVASVSFSPQISVSSSDTANFMITPKKKKQNLRKRCPRNSSPKCFGKGNQKDVAMSSIATSDTKTPTPTRRGRSVVAPTSKQSLKRRSIAYGKPPLTKTKKCRSKTTK